MNRSSRRRDHVTLRRPRNVLLRTDGKSRSCFMALSRLSKTFYLWTFPRWTSSLGKLLLVATGAPQFQMIPVLF